VVAANLPPGRRDRLARGPRGRQRGPQADGDLQGEADLISIGAYQPGSDPAIDAAIAARGPIDSFLKQGVTEPSSAEGADQTLGQLATLGGTTQTHEAPTEEIEQVAQEVNAPAPDEVEGATAGA